MSARLWEEVSEVHGIDWPSDPYEWDYTALLQSTDNPRVFFLYDDGGCSCDGPYDYVTSAADLVQIESTAHLFRLLRDIAGSDPARIRRLHRLRDAYLQARREAKA